MSTNKTSIFKKLLPWILTIVAIIIDQVTKIFVVRFNDPQSLANGYNLDKETTWLSKNPINVIGEWLRISLGYNDAAIFGSTLGLPGEYRQYILMGITAIAIVVIILFFTRIKSDKLFPRACFGLIIGGAIGNFIDRIFGYILYKGECKLFFEKGVVDWIDAGFPFELYKNTWLNDLLPYHRWFTFNMADSFITVSIILLLIYIIATRDTDIFKESKRKSSISIKKDEKNNDDATNDTEKKNDNDEEQKD
jgi:lipoprotein signal peptidase